MNYDDFVAASQSLVGREVSITYVSESGELMVAVLSLTSSAKTAQNGTVTFDATTKEVILLNGLKGSQQDPVQKWDYKLEFGTTMYQKILNPIYSGVHQTNRLWVHYTNPFGMRQSPNSLLVKEIVLLNT
jgi:hypothetical protein